MTRLLPSRHPSRPLLLAWLLLVWLLLWGSVSWLVLLSAGLVAPLCLAASRLPPHSREPWPSPGRLAVVVGRLLVDLVTSSVQLAWATVRRGPRTRAAIVALRVPTSSEVVLAAVANRLTLEPGTIVLEVDRETDTFYVHLLGVGGPETIERQRALAQRSVDDVLRAARAEEHRGTGSAAEQTGGE